MCVDVDSVWQSCKLLDVLQLRRPAVGIERARRGWTGRLTTHLSLLHGNRPGMINHQQLDSGLDLPIGV